MRWYCKINYIYVNLGYEIFIFILYKKYIKCYYYFEFIILYIDYMGQDENVVCDNYMLVIEYFNSFVVG